MFSYSTGKRYDSISLKGVPLTPDGRWYCMFAAGDVSHVLPVIRKAKKEFRYRGSSMPFRQEVVERVCVEAYQARIFEVVNDTILSCYGIDLPTYRREGLNFVATECARINQKIEAVKLHLWLIVFGYDDFNQAHLFIVNDPGKARCCDNDGIAAIGTGAQLANISLLRDERPLHSQAEMLCRVAEAKFEAEQEPRKTVGKDSAVGVFRRPGRMTNPMTEAFISIRLMDAIRKAHEQHHDRQYPRKLLEAVTDEINSEITSEHISRVLYKAEELIRRDNAKRRARSTTRQRK
jgi:hypothetical protein